MTPRDDRRDVRLGLAAACIGTAIWGSAAPLGKAIAAPALVMLLWRQVIATAVLGAIVAARRRPLRRADMRASIYAAAMFGAHLIGFFGAARLTSVAVVVLIYALAPVFIIPIARATLGERPQASVITLAAVAIIGVALVVSGGASRGSHPGWGLLLSIANMGLWVWWSLVAKRARTRQVDTLTWLLFANAGALGVLAVVTLATGQDLGAVDGSDWLRVLALAIGSGLLGHGLNLWAYRHIDVGLASVIGLGEPVLAALGAALFLGESLSVRQAFGIALVIAAIGLVTYRNR